MNKARLLKMADLLERNANDKKGVKFDLGTWGMSDDETMPMTCKTQACAMGVAALSGVFKRAGLRYEVVPGALTLDFSLDGRLHEGPREIDISYGDAHGMEAAEKLFGLTELEATWLFHPDGYGEDAITTGKRAELAVVKRIRKLVAGTISAETFSLTSWCRN